ncbi:MAG: hypothetical protein KAU50_04545, partial [Candidatus Marinimicrobia bacterium]|nr:hypothetical protein [Candidatus Neomarinimicrobiota bacterium]
MTTPWDLSVNLKDVVIDLAWLSLLLIVGAVFRRYVGFFQRFLVPNNIIAGFIGLIIGPQLLGLNNVAMDRLGIYVYHLLALVFIAIGLRQEKTHWGTGPISTGFTFISSYLIQGIVGLLVALILVYTIMPDLFPAIGLLVPLGFGMGPGLAYTMGHSWEHFGFEGGGAVGLTFAAIGFLIAYFTGIPLIRRGIRRHETNLVKGMDHISDEVLRGIHKEPPLKSAGKLTIASEAMEPMAFQMGLIGALYLVTWVVALGLSKLMVAGGLEKFTPTLWSFHFLIANLLSLAVRKVLDRTGHSHVIDRGLMTRSAGLFMDYLVAASIAAISIAIVWVYWLPILIMSLVAGILTYILCRWLMYRAYENYHFERFIGMFGEMTGTLNSGLVLVRVTDPEFDTPVAEDLVYGSGVALLLGFPLLVVLNLPMNIWDNALRGYWITLGILVGYLVVIFAIWRLLGILRFKRGLPESEA